jgi:hypothetical protein
MVLPRNHCKILKIPMPKIKIGGILIVSTITFANFFVTIVSESKYLSALHLTGNDLALWK